MYEDMIRVPFIARYPGRIPAGSRTEAIQSLVDVAPTIQDFCGLEVPGRMSGLSQKGVWSGLLEKVRDHAICEHHHEPTTVHLKTYVDQRYKITVYYNHLYGELYDLEADPNEIQNLWDVPEKFALKHELLMKYIWAEMGKEPMWMPRISGA